MTSEPGWYPVDASTQRYWDGTQWTGHVVPMVQARSQPGLPTWAKVVLGLVAVVVVALPVLAVLVVLVVLIFAIGRVVASS